MMIYIASPLRKSEFVSRHTHEDYAKRALLDSLRRGEAPIAPHLLYPLVLNDEIHTERNLAFDANKALIARAEVIAFYIDFGMSPGMKEELKLARSFGIPLDIRSIGKYEPPAPVEAPPEAIAVPSKSEEILSWSEAVGLEDALEVPEPSPPRLVPGERLPTLLADDE